ncbi:MAG TPA: sigma-70 family RNA polymerase sigma factor [Hyphomicrobiaceae bacterium]|jgi:RNA polymerase sigma-70 factor (ECF subfamily)
MTERAQFERLALAHMPAAYNLAFWLLRSRPDAEDAVQDAYLRAWRSFAGFRGGDIRPWLLQIVRNVAYRRLGDRARATNVIPFDAAVSDRVGGEAALQVAAEGPSAEEALLGAGEQAMVRTALAELAPIFREVVVLREIEALSYREIARLTGVPIGTVMSRLARARAELRRTLARMMKKDESDAV